MTVYIGVVLIFTLCHTNDLACNQAFQCANSSMTIDTMSITGYKSGSLSILISQQVDCFGAFSCAQASFISTDSIMCCGALSCSKISSNIQLNSEHFFPAYGTNAITSTHINAAASRIYCFGEQSCAYSVIVQASVIMAYGAYALLNATIDTLHIQPYNIRIYFYGYYAGYRANIFCRTQHTCNLYCDANACTNIYMHCDNNCAISGHTQDVISPVLLYDVLAIQYQNDALCSAQIDMMKFDDAEERGSQSTYVLDSTYNGGPFCCRGYQSCSQNIIRYKSSTNGSIVCSGTEACSYVYIYSSGNIYCGGWKSCWRSNISTTAKVYCTASASCEYATINGASHVYCSGSNSCEDTIISSGGTDLKVYLLAYRQAISGNNANIICDASDHCSIFCSGAAICRDLNVTCNGLCDIYCDSATFCPIGYTLNPSISPSFSPSSITLIPSASPSFSPSAMPSISPSLVPSTVPSFEPSAYVYPQAASTKRGDSAEVIEQSSATTIEYDMNDDEDKSKYIQPPIQILMMSLSILALLVCVVCIVVMCLYPSKKRAQAHKKQVQRAIQQQNIIDEVMEDSQESEAVKDDDGMKVTDEGIADNHVICIKHQQIIDLKPEATKTDDKAANIADDEFVIQGEETPHASDIVHKRANDNDLHITTNYF